MVNDPVIRSSFSTRASPIPTRQRTETATIPTASQASHLAQPEQGQQAIESAALGRVPPERRSGITARARTRSLQSSGQTVQRALDSPRRGMGSNSYRRPQAGCGPNRHAPVLWSGQYHCRRGSSSRRSDVHRSNATPSFHKPDAFPNGTSNTRIWCRHIVPAPAAAWLARSLSGSPAPAHQELASMIL